MPISRGMGEPAFRNQSLSKVNDLDLSDLGRPDSFRYNILTMVINEEYDRAIRTLKEFIESDSAYPNFRMKIERYALHSIDLIYAIRTKRNFPGLGNLTRTKQQELREKFKEHFKELRFMMKKIEDSVEELRLNDVRSTGIVLKAFLFSLIIIFVSGVALDFAQGLGSSISIVFHEQADRAFEFVFSKFF